MPTIAVVGAGSLLGHEILAALEERKNITEVLAFSEKAVGTEVPFRGEDVVVEELDDEAVAQKPQAVIFATGAARAKRWVAKFAAAGVRVVDASAAHRLEADVPLAGIGAVPTSKGRVFAVAGAAPLAAARLLGKAFANAKAPRLSATLLVPVSSAGQAGVLELSRQTAALLSGRAAKPRHFPHRIAFNIVPEVGEAEAEDSTLERAFVSELRRLVGRPDLAVAATAVRVPVFYGLSLVLNGTGVDAAELRRQLTGQPGIKLLQGKGVYPMPSLSVGDGSLLVGRVRDDGNGGYQLVATVDPLRLVAEVAVATAV
jgi:aspartate-semialdehyde dehydrogenase